MQLGHAVNYASGLSREASNALGYRFDEAVGFQPDGGESWVLGITPGLLHCLWGKRGWLTGLWRSAAGKVFATEAYGRVHTIADAQPNAPWDVTEVPGLLEGVWGLDEEHVYVWGRDRGTPLLHRWDGQTFSRIESPGQLVAMHGVAPDLLIGVGEEGLISRWDGGRWHPFKAVSSRSLSSVFVASEDEIYACSVSGDILQGSVHGWSKVLSDDRLSGCIAKWQGRWWVGVGGEMGLCVLEGASLVSRKPNVIPTTMDVRQDLVMASNLGVVDTADGESYMASLTDDFARAAAMNCDPLWLNDDGEWKDD